MFNQEKNRNLSFLMTNNIKTNKMSRYSTKLSKCAAVSVSHYVMTQTTVNKSSSVRKPNIIQSHCCSRIELEAMPVRMVVFSVPIQLHIDSQCSSIFHVSAHVSIIVCWFCCPEVTHSLAGVKHTRVDTHQLHGRTDARLGRCIEIIQLIKQKKENKT